jgi:signal transduction histidine kinase
VRIIAQNAEARALCQRLGLEAADHLGHLSQSPDELARLWSSLTDTLADRDRPVTPFPINAPTYGDVERGETVHVLPRFSVPRGAANPLDELVLALTDVTALRQTELALGRTTRDLERTHADLAQVSWAAAHDLNEPLKAALGFAELFEAQHHDTLARDAAAVFDAVHQSVRRVQLLLRDLLAYTRLQAYPEDRERFSLALPLQDALGQLDAELRACEAVVRLEPAVGVWPEVEGDRTALSLVFRHLLENATKFRGAGPPHIDVRCERQPGVVHVEVTDDGIGFPPEFALRIFEVFQRLHTSSEYAGTGMGLAICRRIVIGHGGQIHARSRARQGATFTFTIPACGPESFDDASLVPQS